MAKRTASRDDPYVAKILELERAGEAIELAARALHLAVPDPLTQAGALWRCEVRLDGGEPSTLGLRIGGALLMRISFKDARQGRIQASVTVDAEALLAGWRDKAAVQQALASIGVAVGAVAEGEVPIDEELKSSARQTGGPIRQTRFWMTRGEALTLSGEIRNLRLALRLEPVALAVCVAGAWMPALCRPSEESMHNEMMATMILGY